MMSARVRDENSNVAGVLMLLAARWRSIAINGTMPEPPATRNSGPARASAPDEIAADRPAHFELIAGARLAGEIGRHLAIRQRSTVSVTCASLGAEAIE